MGEKIRMALIATYPKMAEIFLNLIDAREDIVAYSIYASFEEAADVAKKMEGELDIILSRGGTAAYIKEAVHIPVTFIPITPFDVVKVVHDLGKEIKEAAFIHYKRNVYGIQDIARMYGITIHEYSFLNYDDIIHAVQDAHEKGIDTIIGGHVALEEAKKLGMKGIEVSAGVEAVDRAIDESLTVLNEVRREQRRTARLNAAFNALNEGIIITDDKRKVTMANKTGQKVYGKKYRPGDIAGEDIINSVCNRVYEDYQEKPVYIEKIKNTTYAITHHPVIQNEKFLGVVNRYEDITQTVALEQKIRKEMHTKGFVAKYRFEDILANNDRMDMVKKEAEIYGKTDSSILIQGESGTGKELFAQSIHNISRRANGPFVAVNCAAIPESLLESELFGYEKGAFTGAQKEGKAGYFEMAHLGTLFLDEIGEVSKTVQTRLLRVLQEREVMRVGGNKIIPVDVRVISATNKDLKKEIEEGNFREDLYYRLNILNVHIPPLRERKDDVVLMAKSFVTDNDLDENIVDEIAPMLKNYNWPGNVRELRNVAERYSALYDFIADGSLPEDNMGEFLGISNAAKIERGKELAVKIPYGKNLSEIIEQVEYEVTHWYLDECNNDQEMAAKALGIGRTTFWRKSKEKNMQKE